MPSLTESVAITRPEALVGATDWCTHPTGLAVTRIRGTKNPDIAQMIALAPDLVIANKEGNRHIDVHRLREGGVPVWVAGRDDPGHRLTDPAVHRRAALGCARLARRRPGPPGYRPVPDERARVAVPIWRDPWMVVGRNTFTGDLLRRRGYHNVFAHHPDRYPAASTA